MSRPRNTADNIASSIDPNVYHSPKSRPWTPHPSPSPLLRRHCRVHHVTRRRHCGASVFGKPVFAATHWTLWSQRFTGLSLSLVSSPPRPARFSAAPWRPPRRAATCCWSWDSPVPASTRSISWRRWKKVGWRFSLKKKRIWGQGCAICRAMRQMTFRDISIVMHVIQ